MVHHTAFHIATRPEDAGSFVKANTFAEFLQYEPPDDTSDVSMDERWSHVRIETALYAQHDNISSGSLIDDVVITTASDYVIPEASKAIYVSPDTTGVGADTHPYATWSLCALEEIDNIKYWVQHAPTLCTNTHSSE